MKIINMGNRGLTHDQICEAMQGKVFTLRGLSLELDDDSIDTPDSIAIKAATIEGKRKEAVAITVESLMDALVKKALILREDVEAAAIENMEKGKAKADA